jgi:hypothetical protein
MTTMEEIKAQIKKVDFFLGRNRDLTDSARTKYRNDLRQVASLTATRVYVSGPFKGLKVAPEQADLDKALKITKRVAADLAEYEYLKSVG